MNSSRLIKHLLSGPLSVQRCFPQQGLAEIAQAITASELRHGGELRVCIEASLGLLDVLRDKSARARAIEVFSELRLWDTEENTGVLLFVLLADRSIEIVADRGINRRVKESQWAEICDLIKANFAQRLFVEGVLEGISAISALLAAHFPPPQVNVDELPDDVVIK